MEKMEKYESFKYVFESVGFIAIIFLAMPLLVTLTIYGLIGDK